MKIPDFNVHRKSLTHDILLFMLNLTVLSTA